jgi:hypothetical protein
MYKSAIENAAQTAINSFDGPLPYGLTVTDDFVLGRPNQERLAIVWRPWQTILRTYARFGDDALLHTLFSPDANLAHWGRVNMRGRIVGRRYLITEYAATRNSLAVFKKNIVGRKLFATLDPDATEYAKEELKL